MSTTKVIFTYKRKRLSSCSNDHASGCPDFSPDKHLDACEGRSETLKSDIKSLKCINVDDVDMSMNCESCLDPCRRRHVGSAHELACQGEVLSSACSSPRLHSSSINGESNHAERSDAIITRETMLVSREFAGDSAFKSSGTNISAGASLSEATSSSRKDFCLDLNYSSPPGDAHVLGSSASQTEENDTGSLKKQRYHGNFEIAKPKLASPLLTFSRRLKRKEDAGSQDMNSKPPLRDGTSAVKDGKSMCVSSCSCEPLPILPSGDAKMKSVQCQGKDGTICKEVRDSPRSCTHGLAHTKGKQCCGEDLIVDASAIADQTVTNTSGSRAFLTGEATNLSKENVECSSNMGIAVSCCGDSCKTNKHHLSNQFQQASSGDSQLTSSDGSDSNIFAGKTVEQKASATSLDLSCPPRGSLVIDCNVVPESNLEEETCTVANHDSISVNKSCGNCMQDGHLKNKSLELFRDACVQAEDSHLVGSSKDACTSVQAESKPNSKWLQLSSDDGKSYQFPPANTNSDVDSRKAGKNKAFGLDNRRNWLEQSSSRASTSLSLSVPTEPKLGQTSKHGSGSQPYRDPKLKNRDFIQNPLALPFPDHASYILRHNKMLETINSKATALRGNRNISLDKFEPYPTIWSEEELDSLWIGVRRHGRGNWHAMLLDPRLRFLPWRTARDLAEQWGREQCKLLNGQHISQVRYPNPGEPCNLECNGIMREVISAETQLSLGDVYATKEGSSYRSGPSTYGITPTNSKQARMANCGLLNNFQINVMVRGDASPDGLAIGLATNHHQPREQADILSRTSELTQPPIPALSQMGAPHLFGEHSGTSHRSKNPAMVAEVQPTNGFHNDRPSTRKRVMTDNVVVIDSSDASSEETISDDHNVRR